MPVARAPNRISRAEVRRRLEDEAAALFARNGYAGTTIDDIVAAAGVSKPALYRHFESKQHLHMTLLERHRDELAAAALAAGFDRTGDVEARVHAMLDAWFGYVEQHPYTSLMFRDPPNDPDVQALHRDLQARQRAADVALLREFAPTIPEREIEPLAETVRSSLYGLALMWLDDPALEREVLVAAMTRLVLGLLLAAPRNP